MKKYENKQVEEFKGKVKKWLKRKRRSSKNGYIWAKINLEVLYL